jgi:signal-transduction protein with cAMP-binding, CBS, and nucleotidyltransferase domain
VGSAMFSEIAESFAPFRELLAEAVTQRSGDLWRRLPLAKSLLDGEPLASLLDPLPAKLLSRQTTLADAIQALNESPTGQLLVLDEKQQVWGTFDRNDLYQIVARIAVTPQSKEADSALRTLGELLPGGTVHATLEDSLLAATATMLDHRSSWLPVVQSINDLRPVGSLRAEKISIRLIQKIGIAPGQAKAAS